MICKPVNGNRAACIPIVTLQVVSTCKKLSHHKLFPLPINPAKDLKEGVDAWRIAMSILNLDKFDAAKLQKEPCDYIIVPGFVRPDALEGLNADFPAISRPGNFPLEELSYGPKFKSLIDELTGPDVRRHFAEKFGMDLDSYPTQVTIRKFMSSLDGNIHNDSRSKKITVLIYFNDEWTQEGGQLRITKAIDKIDDYYVQIPPVRGNLIAFRRNERSFHGFPSASGERRSLQMYWVEPKRLSRHKPTGIRKAIHKFFKRTFRKK